MTMVARRSFSAAQLAFGFDPAVYRWAGGVVVDNFAGGGGASTGLAWGIGRSPHIAVNHNAVALAMHEENHPETAHLCESVWEVDPRKATEGRPVLLGWFSPDCRHFSKASGGKPVEKKIRGLAWVATKWSGQSDMAVGMLENVSEFETWGPLVAVRDKATGRVVKTDGTVAAKGERVPLECQQLRPDPKRKGRTFRAFVRHLEGLGYEVQRRSLVACDYGAPTSRKRFFMVWRKDGLPIVWPTPTHGHPKSLEVQTGRRLPWRTAGEIIDWSVPAPSIFERSKPLADATLRRVARGVMRYVVEAGDNAFVVGLPSGQRAVPTLVQTGYGERPGQSPRVPGLENPLGTIVGTGNKHGLVVPVLATIDHQSSGDGTSRDSSAPMAPATSKNRHGLVVAFLAKNFTGVVGSDLDSPIHTITATDHHAVVASHLVRLKSNGRQGQGLDEPVGSIQAQGNHFAEVRAFLVKYYATGIDASLDEPIDTITAKPRFGLATIHGVDFAIVDIGFRMLEPHELFAGQGFPADYRHREVTMGGKRVKLTKSAQVAACGNSVPPQLPAALVRANVPWAAVWPDGLDRAEMGKAK